MPKQNMLKQKVANNNEKKKNKRSCERVGKQKKIRIDANDPK